MKPLYCRKHKITFNPETISLCPLCKNDTNYYVSDKLKAQLEAKKKAGKLTSYLKNKYGV